EGLGLLGSVGVLGACVDLELGQLLTTEGGLGNHAADRLLDSLLRALGKQLGVGLAPKATGEAGVPVGELLLGLGAGEGDLVGVDDDDEVTGVDVRREDRLVLAAQQRGGLAGQAAEDDVGGVNDMPLAGDVARLGGIGT